MSALAMLSSLARAFFALWALLLLLVCTVNMLLSLQKRRYLLSLAAAVLLVPAFFLWQVIFDLSLSVRLGIPASPVGQSLCDIAWGWWAVALLVFTLGCAALLVYHIRYEKKNVTPNSIKTYLDKMPCGVCCWLDSGKVLFSNICMNRLCLALTDGPLRNGNLFLAAVEKGILSIAACRKLST